MRSNKLQTKQIEQIRLATFSQIRIRYSFGSSGRSGPERQEITTGRPKNSNSNFEEIHEKHLWVHECL